MDASTSSVTGVGDQGRQKRVLPSRSRRGGPGVGSCDIDILILDTQKSKLAEHLIPPNTPFLLTTNGALEDCSSDADRVVNTVVNERYFSRPEVIKAYREQKIIQTPDCKDLKDGSSVGGRFRPRDTDQAFVDTSDAAYEKRHKKYETFEKRGRYREKEKLQHEHYKLKERIEQLRAMDGSAFLTLPTSFFSPIPRISDADDESRTTSILPGAHTNGVAAYNEGERRRKEMLETANFLDERYRILLPPERIRRTRPNDIVGNAIMDEEDNEDGLAASLPAQKETEKLKFRIPARSTTSTPSAPSPSYYKSQYISTSTKKSRLSAPPAKQPSNKGRKDSSVPPLTSELQQTHTSPPPINPLQIIMVRPEDNLEHTPDIDIEGNDSQLPDSRQSSPSASLLSIPTKDVTLIPNGVASTSEIAAAAISDTNLTPSHESISYAVTEHPQSISVTRPKKRVKPSLPPRAPSLPPITSISTSSIQWPLQLSTVQVSAKKTHAGTLSKSERKKCIIFHTAHRHVSTREKAPRHNLAFGVKLPSILTEQREFGLPPWFLESYEHPTMMHGPDTMAGRSPDGSGHSDDELDASTLEHENSPRMEEVMHGMQETK